MTDRPRKSSVGGPARLVCRCIGISSTRIVATAQQLRLSSVQELRDAIHASSACGGCEAEIDEILAELAGEPIPRIQQIDNAMICRSETRARIEGSLATGITPKLPPNTDVELISVDGLTVELAVRPDQAPLREQISERLRKYVCQDLEIHFKP